MQWNEKNSVLSESKLQLDPCEVPSWLKWVATKSPVPILWYTLFTSMSYSTSFEDEEGLPSVVEGKIIKAGSYCRIICHFSFHKVAAVAVYSSYWWKRLLERCFDGFQMQCSFQILIQSYPNEFIGLCK